jgi:hypothetical protein
VFVEVVIVFVLSVIAPLKSAPALIPPALIPPYHSLSSNPFLIQVSEVIGMAVLLVVVLGGFQTFLYYFAKPAANFI